MRISKAKNKSKNHKKSLRFNPAFTIIELLVVISIIAILSAIVIVSYGSWKQSTVVAQLKSDLNNVASAMENYRTFNNGYPTSVPSTFTASSGVTLSGGSLDSGVTYCVSAVNSQFPSIFYHIDSTNSGTGATSGVCPAPTVGYSLAYAADPNGSITGFNLQAVSPGGNGTAVTAVPATNYSFVNWSDGSSANPRTDTNVNADISVTANFAPISISAPAAPTVTISQPDGSNTMWSWGDTDCGTNTARYQYDYTITPSGYDTGWVATDGTSVVFTTSTTGRTYTVTVQAQCYSAVASSAWSASGSSSYLRNGAGADGAITVAAGKNINTDTIATSRTCADAANYSVTSLTVNTAVLSSTPAAGCFAIGDEILLINLQGISSNYTNVGNYEALRISSISTNTIIFTGNKTKYYGNGASDDTNIGTATSNQRVMLQRVPNYTNVTINSGITLTANAWDGVKGGVLFFRATGTVAVVGIVNMSSKGYMQGGVGVVGSFSGESRPGRLAGTTCAAYDGAAGFTGNQTSGYLGGGGGGYATAGQTGTNSGNGCAGIGGGIYGTTNLSQIFFGSGGSGRHSNLSVGGGIVIISGSTINVTGSIVAKGGTGWCCDANNADGSGAGGSILLGGTTVTIGSSLVQAIGGPAQVYAGAGGTGRVTIYYGTLSGTTSPTSTNYLGSFPF